MFFLKVTLKSKLFIRIHFCFGTWAGVLLIVILVVDLWVTACSRIADSSFLECSHCLFDLIPCGLVAWNPSDLH